MRPRSQQKPAPAPCWQPAPRRCRPGPLAASPEHVREEESRRLTVSFWLQRRAYAPEGPPPRDGCPRTVPVARGPTHLGLLPFLLSQLPLPPGFQNVVAIPVNRGFLGLLLPCGSCHVPLTAISGEFGMKERICRPSDDPLKDRPLRALLFPRGWQDPANHNRLFWASSSRS